MYENFELNLNFKKLNNFKILSEIPFGKQHVHLNSERNAPIDKTMYKIRNDASMYNFHCFWLREVISVPV